MSVCLKSCPLWGLGTSEWLEQGWEAVAAPSGKLHPTYLEKISYTVISFSYETVIFISKGTVNYKYSKWQCLG
jgi:hypothetical protein